MNKGTNSIEEFSSFLTFVLDRPPMFLINRVEDIEVFLIGYQYATNDEQLKDFISNFKAFVEKNYRVKNHLPWSKWVRLEATSDIHSLQLVKGLFDSYYTTWKKANNKKRIQKS